VASMTREQRDALKRELLRVKSQDVV